jgi:hypothetical protein
LEDNHEQRKATVTPAAKKLSALLLLLYALTISFFTPLPCTANKKIRTGHWFGAVTTNDSSSKPERQQPLHNAGERSSRNTDEHSSRDTAERTQQSRNTAARNTNERSSRNATINNIYRPTL